jgi:hypothetical protein
LEFGEPPLGGRSDEVNSAALVSSTTKKNRGTVWPYRVQPTLHWVSAKQLKHEDISAEKQINELSAHYETFVDELLPLE